MADLQANQDGNIPIASAGPDGAQANIFANGGGTPNSISTGNNPSDPTIRTGDGGTILMSSANRIDNGGWVLANARNAGSTNENGGNGGTIVMSAASQISNTGRIVTDGGSGVHGGNAGVIAFSYKDGLQHSGVICIWQDKNVPSWRRKSVPL